MQHAQIRAFLHAAALALAASLAACKGLEVPKVPGVTPYRIVIQQGNYISQEMVSQLKPGMTREQVRFVLGTPLVADIFHADRWDYVYFIELPNGRRDQRNLAVVFESGKLARVIGDLMPPEASKPAAAAFPSQIPAEAKPAAKPAPAAAAKPPEAAKPAAAAERPQGDSVPNWRAASEAPPAAATPSPEPSPPPAAAAEEKKEERGFFGRLLYRFKPGEAAPIKPEVPTKPEAAPEPQLQAQPEQPKPEPAREAAKEEKPAAEEEKGFFGRLREKIGL